MLIQNPGVSDIAMSKVCRALGHAGDCLARRQREPGRSFSDISLIDPAAAAQGPCKVVPRAVSHLPSARLRIGVFGASAAKPR